MAAEQIIFILVAAVTLGAAISVVTSRNLIHSALWLILALFGVAIFYVLLDAGFFAVIQVIIYIGAIAILFIFAAMLTRRDAGNRSTIQFHLVAGSIDRGVIVRWHCPDFHKLAGFHHDSFRSRQSRWEDCPAWSGVSIS